MNSRWSNVWFRFAEHLNQRGDGNHIPLCCCIVSSFMIYHLFVTRVTRRIPLVEQEILTLQSSWVHHRFLMGFVLLDLFCVVFCTSLFFFFVLFLLANMVSVLLRFTASDYTFGISNFPYTYTFRTFLSPVHPVFLQNICVVTFSNKQWRSMLIFIQMDRSWERRVTTNKLLLMKFNV